MLTLLSCSCHSPVFCVYYKLFSGNNAGQTGDDAMLYDKDIREPLFDFLEERCGKIRIIEEKQMGKSRADVVAVLVDAVCGIEIKSDADTYARLDRQIKDYDKYFDRNYIVVGTSHAFHVKEHVPDYWGIITVEQADGAADFYVMREAAANPKMDWKRKLSILWRPELLHIQEINGLPRYREKSKRFVIEKLLLKVSKEKLSLQISEELFERDYTTIAEEIDSYRRKRRY